MTALMPFPKWVLCQLLVNKVLCCKKHRHSWLQGARQKPKTWILRNLLGNFPGKEKRLTTGILNRNVGSAWLGSSVDPNYKTYKLLSTPHARKDTRLTGRAPHTWGPSFPSLMLACFDPWSQGRHLANTATSLSWVAPRGHKRKSTFVCEVSHLKYHTKGSQERFWSFLPSVDQTLLPAQTVQPDQHDRYSCKEYNFSWFSTYLPSPSAICWHENVL